MIGQQTDRRERDGSISESIQNDRTLSCRTCGFDPSVGCVFRQAQTARAIDEHRRVSLLQIPTTYVDFTEQRNDVSRGSSLARGGGFGIAQQAFIREQSNGVGVHEPVVASSCRTGRRWLQ